METTIAYDLARTVVVSEVRVVLVGVSSMVSTLIPFPTLSSFPLQEYIAMSGRVFHQSIEVSNLTYPGVYTPSATMDIQYVCLPMLFGEDCDRLKTVQY